MHPFAVSCIFSPCRFQWVDVNNFVLIASLVSVVYHQFVIVCCTLAGMEGLLQYVATTARWFSSWGLKAPGQLFTYIGNSASFSCKQSICMYCTLYFYLGCEEEEN